CDWSSAVCPSDLRSLRCGGAGRGGAGRGPCRGLELPRPDQVRRGRHQEGRGDEAVAGRQRAHREGEGARRRGQSASYRRQGQDRSRQRDVEGQGGPVAGRVRCRHLHALSMPAAKPRIGFIGLATMGGQMARRLVSQGFVVRGYDVSAERAAQAKTAGVILESSPGHVAAAADGVLSSLPDPAAVRIAYLGESGVLAGAHAGMTWIDLSTIDPETCREVAASAAAAKIDCLDAPVSGGPVEAGTGKLLFIVGGDAAVLERCRPVLMALATEIHHVGPLGSGLVVKLVNNLMSMGNMAVAAEAMVLGVKAGIEPRRLFDIL